MFHLFTWRFHLIQKPLPAIIPSTRKDGTWFVYTRIIIQRTFIWVSVASVLKKAAAQVVLKKFLCPTIMLAISAWENDLSLVLESIDNKEKNLALIFKNNKKEQVLSIFTKRFKSSIYNFSQKNPLQGIKRVQYFPHYILSLQCHQK